MSPPSVGGKGVSMLRARPLLGLVSVVLASILGEYLPLVFIAR